MTDLPAILAIGGSFDVGKDRYTWSPLTLRDEADMEVELRELLGDRMNVVENFKPTLRQLTGHDREVALELAIKEQFRLERMRGVELAQEFEFADVDALLFKYHLRAYHPDLTLDDVRSMMTLDVVETAMRGISQQIREGQPDPPNGPLSGDSTASPEMKTPETIATASP